MNQIKQYKYMQLNYLDNTQTDKFTDMINNYYGRDMPIVGEHVVAEITKLIEGGGYFVKLLEYGGKQGFVGIRDVSTTKFKKLKGIVKINTIEVMQVVNINGNNIDLTRKHIDTETINETLTKYHNYKSLYNWLDHNSKYDNELKFKYINDVILKEYNDVNYIKMFQNEHIQEIKDDYKELHKDIISFINKNKLDKIQSAEICIKELSNYNIQTVNSHLNILRESMNVDIETINTRKCQYRITSKTKMNEDNFNYVLEQIIYMQINKRDDNIIMETIDIVSPSISSQSQPQVNIGIIGHVSHGKTTLIHSMTGVDTRRHKSEMKSNKTLKLGYTNMIITRCICNSEIEYKTSATSCNCDKVHISIVDCPGHNILLPTMIAGSHLMDAALLLISANEKFPQPQTKEHMDVVKLVNKVNDVICIQNKLDTVNKETALVQKLEIEKFNQDYDIQDNHIIPISAQKNVNVDLVIENMFDISKRIIDNKKMKQQNDNYGLIVRTFDINKPGDKEIKGLVIGGSVIKGEFNVNDMIIIMPQKIKGRVLSIKSDNNMLMKAHSGGLIALQTDINPVYCDALIGSSFILENQYNDKKYYDKSSKIKIKYYSLEDNKTSYLKKGQKVTINIMAYDIECDVIKSKDKYKCTIELSKPVYILEQFTFVIIHNKRLFGCGKEYNSCDNDHENINKHLFYNKLSYQDMFEMYQNKYAIEHAPRPKKILPLPKIQYLNTFSTILNFNDYCNIINTSPRELGLFIFNEQGFKTWSINAQNQLIIKGRITENKLMSNIVKFCSYKVCSRCKSTETFNYNDRGVKKIMCKDCNWSEPVR